MLNKLSASRRLLRAVVHCHQLKLRRELFKGDKHNYRLIVDFTLFLKLKQRNE